MKIINKLLVKQYFYIVYFFLSKHLFSYFGLAKRPEKKFIIVSRSRTGSTMLVQHIRKISGAFVLGEILGRSKGFIFWKKFIPLFYSWHWHKNTVIGFKYFYYHPVDNDALNEIVLNYLKNNPDIIIIHLIREDLFAVVLSKIIAEQTGQWSKKNNSKKNDLVSFEVDINVFKKEINDTYLYVEKYDNYFIERDNYLKVSYEDLIDGNGLDQVFKLLDYKGKPQQSVDKSKKQKTSSLYNKVLNFEELKLIYEQEKKANSSYSGKP